MVFPVLDDLPGFRRRFRIVPEQGRVSCELEDDIHCMVVEIQHDGTIATAVSGHMRRAPWTTCPGAERQVQETFTGAALDQFRVRGGKKSNCTHLYDLAVMAATHAFEPTVVIYDLLVSDPVDNRRYAEVRRNGECLMRWVEEKFQVVEPAELAGMSLAGDLSPWISGCDPQQQEAARLLRWANMMANGRIMPLEDQSDATRMPPNCYTFQPERAVVAVRVGEIKDFSDGRHTPLEEYPLEEFPSEG